MTAYIPEGFGEIAFRYALSGDPQEMLCTLGFANLDEEDTTVADLQAAALRVQTAWKTALHNATTTLVTGWTYLGAKYTLHGSDSELPYIGYVNDAVVGSSTGETLPVNSALLVRKNSNLGGRNHRGRMYLPLYATAEGSISKLGVIDSGDVAALQTRLNNFYSALSAGTPVVLPYILHGMVLVSPGPPPVYEPPTVVPTVMSGFTVQGTIATQRRRLRP